MTQFEEDYHKSPAEAKETPHNAYPSPLLIASSDLELFILCFVQSLAPKKGSHFTMHLGEVRGSQMKMWRWTCTHRYLHIILTQEETRRTQQGETPAYDSHLLVIVFFFFSLCELWLFQRNEIQIALQPAEGRMGICLCCWVDWGWLQVSYFSKLTIEGAVL